MNAGTSDFVPQDLTDDDECDLCETLGPIIERWGMATVMEALDAIKCAGSWNRT